MNAIRALIVVSTLTVAAPLLAQEAQMLKGEVVKVDEPAGKIGIRLEQGGTTGASAAGATEEFGVKDGLLFNAVKPGDKVTFSVETVNGQKRISKLAPQ